MRRSTLGGEPTPGGETTPGGLRSGWEGGVGGGGSGSPSLLGSWVALGQLEAIRDSWGVLGGLRLFLRGFLGTIAGAVGLQRIRAQAKGLLLFRANAHVDEAPCEGELWSRSADRPGLLNAPTATTPV